MICPKCEGKTRVVDSRGVELNTYRKRECKECGNIFITEETEIEDRTALRFFYAEAQRQHRYKMAKVGIKND